MRKGRTRVEYRRKREGRTDYKKRLALLLGNRPRLVVRKSNKGILMQLIEYAPDGDKIVESADAGQLKKYGWLSSRSNIPAAYLTGLLLGKKAAQKKIQEAILDLGLYNPTKGSRLYAAIKGASDAGLKIPHTEEVLPPAERIEGGHISAYAKKLKAGNHDKFQRLNSQYIANKIEPENFRQYFERVKEQISRGK